MDGEAGVPARIPEDSTAAITAANLLGDKFIDITKGEVQDAGQAGRRAALAQGRTSPN